MASAATNEGIHPYLYTMGNPVNGTDPTGFATECIEIPAGQAIPEGYEECAGCEAAGLPVAEMRTIGPDGAQGSRDAASAAAAAAVASSGGPGGGGSSAGSGGTGFSGGGNGSSEGSGASGAISEALSVGVSDGKRTTGTGQNGPTAMQVVHGILGGLGFVPGLGTLADVFDAALYVYEGDYTSAGLSMLSAVPGAGDALAIGVKAKAAAGAAGGLAMFFQRGISFGDDAARGAERTFEIVDGVRRAKAAELAGRTTISAEIRVGGKVVGTTEVPLSTLRSPFKDAIDVSSSPAQMQRFQSILKGTRAGDALPPITVQPGARGPSIFDVFFK
jgi:hypothetical protein